MRTARIETTAAAASCAGLSSRKYKIPNFPIPSSHHYAAASFANLGIEGHKQLIDLVRFWFRIPHDELAARTLRTSEPATLGAFGIIAVKPLAHFLARLEERDALLIDRHMGAGTRIASGAGGAMLDRERAEAAQLDTVAARERSNDLIEDRVHDILDIPLVEVRVVLGNTLNKL